MHQARMPSAFYDSVSIVTQCRRAPDTCLPHRRLHDQHVAGGVLQAGCQQVRLALTTDGARAPRPAPAPADHRARTPVLPRRMLPS